MTGNLITQVWDAVAGSGWDAGHAHLAGIYPMPGSREFEDDDSFRRLPLFPAGEGRPVTVASDAVWHLPREWFRDWETRPPNIFSLRVGLDPSEGNFLDLERVGLATRRAMYLEIFRSRRPLGLSALRSRLRFYRLVARFSVAEGKPVQDWLLSDLGAFIDTLGTADRKSLTSIYEMLRWWKASSGDRYPLFELPPSLKAIAAASESDATDEALAYEGVDTARIREDADPAVTGTWQPFPDDFVAAVGEFCIRLLEDVAPLVDSCLRRVVAVPPSRRKAIAAVAAAQTSWPEGMEVGTLRELRTQAYLCQSALVFLLSLILGCRWSEISALPISALVVSVLVVEKRTSNGVTEVATGLAG